MSTLKELLSNPKFQTATPEQQKRIRAKFLQEVVEPNESYQTLPEEGKRKVVKAVLREEFPLALQAGETTRRTDISPREVASAQILQELRSGKLTGEEFARERTTAEPLVAETPPGLLARTLAPEPKDEAAIRGELEARHPVRSTVHQGVGMLASLLGGTRVAGLPVAIGAAKGLESAGVASKSAELSGRLLSTGAVGTGITTASELARQREAGDIEPKTLIKKAVKDFLFFTTLGGVNNIKKIPARVISSAALGATAALNDGPTAMGVNAAIFALFSIPGSGAEGTEIRDDLIRGAKRSLAQRFRESARAGKEKVADEIADPLADRVVNRLVREIEIRASRPIQITEAETLKKAIDLGLDIDLKDMAGATATAAKEATDDLLRITRIEKITPPSAEAPPIRPAPPAPEPAGRGIPLPPPPPALALAPQVATRPPVAEAPAPAQFERGTNIKPEVGKKIFVKDKIKTIKAITPKGVIQLAEGGTLQGKTVVEAKAVPGAVTGKAVVGKEVVTPTAAGGEAAGGAKLGQRVAEPEAASPVTVVRRFSEIAKRTSKDAFLYLERPAPQIVSKLKEMTGLGLSEFWEASQKGIPEVKITKVTQPVGAKPAPSEKQPISKGEIAPRLPTTPSAGKAAQVVPATPSAPSGASVANLSPQEKRVVEKPREDVVYEVELKLQRPGQQIAITHTYLTQSEIDAIKQTGSYSGGKVYDIMSVVPHRRNDSPASSKTIWKEVDMAEVYANPEERRALQEARKLERGKSRKLSDKKRRENADRLRNEGGFVSVPVSQEQIDKLRDLFDEGAFKGLRGSKRLSRLFSMSFWMGQRHPEFLRVYNEMEQSNYAANRVVAMGKKAVQNWIIYDRLPVFTQKKISDAIWEGNDKIRQRYFSPEELTQRGFSLVEQKVYKGLLDLVDVTQRSIVEAMKVKAGFYDLPPLMQEVVSKEIEAAVKRLDGYFPIMRRGEFIVHGETPDGDLHTSPGFPTPKQAQRELDQLRKEGFTNLKVSEAQKVVLENIQRLSQFDLMMLLESAGVDAQTPEILKLREELAERNVRGIQKHFIKRKWVPGYARTPQNVKESAEAFLHAGARMLSRALFDRNVTEAANAIGDSELKRYASDFIKAFNESSADQWAGVRHGLSLWYLGLKFSFPVLNLSQSITATLPMLVAKGAGSQALPIWTRAHQESLQFVHSYLTPGKTSSLDPALERSLLDAIDEGSISRQYVDLMFAHDVPEGKMIGKIDKWLSALGGGTEFYNRVHAHIAGWHLSEMQGKGALIRHIDANALVNSTQYPYGKRNLPQFISNAGKFRDFLKTLYVFRSFSHNYIQMLINLLRINKSAFFTAIGAFLALSGIRGLPGFGLVRLGMREAFGTDVDNELRDMLDEVGVEGVVQDALLGGLPVFMGLDGNTLFGLGDIIPLESLIEHRRLTALGGVIGDLGDAIKSISKEEPGLATEYASPVAISKLLRAIRYTGDFSARTSDLEYLTDVTRGDLVATALGFQPMRVSKAYEAKRSERALIIQRRNITNRFNRLLGKAYAFDDMKKVDAVVEEIERHNQTAPEELFYTYNWQAINKRVDDIRNGWNLKKVPVPLREEVMRIRERLGVGRKENKSSRTAEFRERLRKLKEQRLERSETDEGNTRK